MRSIVLALTGLAALALSACRTAYVGDETSPYYTAPVGSRLVLNRPLDIPADRAVVLLQYGDVVPDGDAYTYDPHCELELRRRLPTARTLAPDEFVVTRVSQELAHSVDAGLRLYADASNALGIAFFSALDDDGPSIRAFVTHMYVDSGRQPEVFRLSCGIWGYPREDRHVTINEIRRAVGEVITLRVAEPRP